MTTTMISRTSNVTRLIAYCAVILVMAGLFLVAQHAFGGAGGAAGSSSNPSRCSGCNQTYNSGAAMNVRGSGLRGTYTDVNRDGRLSNGDRVSTVDGGGGGRGSNGNGGCSAAGGVGCGGGTSQPRACNLSVNKPVIALGSTALTLSWTPTPAGAVTLRRGTGRSDGRTTEAVAGATLTVPNKAVSFTDTVAPTKTGNITYTLSFASAAGAVRGASTEMEDEMNIDAVDSVPVTSFFWNPGAFLTSLITPAYASHGGTGKSSDAGGDHSGGGGSFRGGAMGSGGDSSITGGSGSRGYACTVTLRVVTAVTECNDGIDNGDGEDALIDQQDPGCHPSDGNPGNTSSYDQNDTSESNTPADMRPSLSVNGAVAVGRTVQVTASARNTGTSFASSNDLVYGYRDTDPDRAPKNCSGSSRRCFTHNGRNYTRLDTYARSYIAGEQRTAPTRDFTPTMAGNYELCAIADYRNSVAEGAAGEANNSTCRSINVTDVPTNLSNINGDITLNADPERVRSGLTSVLTWNTGGRVACTLTGSNGESIAVNAMTGTAPTRAITAQTVYTLACTDAGFVGQEQATINILPRFQEI